MKSKPTSGSSCEPDVLSGDFMKRWMVFVLEAVLLLSGRAAEKETAVPETTGMLTGGTEIQRGFLQDMLYRRDSSEGQSMLIAAAKWLGTLAPTIQQGIV